jgi:calcium permeable stress-gated cation channel
VEHNPWLGEVLAQLAPFILVIFVSLLPVFLLAFVGWEKHISIASYQHPSLFNKVAWFTIIQTFFVSTISGAITSELQNIVTNGPSYAIELLAKALPGQASYFIQIILVQNWLGLGSELLRTSALIQRVLRYLIGKLLGYGLTEKERTSSFLGLRVFSDPSEYEFGRKLGGETMLLLMVLFVHGSMSPIVCYFTLFIFLLQSMGFRNQFCFVYPIANDSGGTLFICFVKIGIICMIIAEIVLAGVLALNQSPIAVGLMVPLIVVAILFSSYVGRP